MSNPSIYMAASGGMAQYERLEHLSNNLANVDTTGFKGSRAIFSAERPDYPSQLRLSPIPGSDAANRALSYARIAEVSNDLSQGSIEETGNPLDVALGGEGWLEVEGPTGPLYTRAGSLSISRDGTLVTKDGMAVQGQGGPIQLKSPPSFIDSDGALHGPNGELGRLKVVDFEAGTQLKRFGMALFEAIGPEGAPATATPKDNPQVLQGSLETSNVNPVSAMVELISAQRAFEQFQKTLQNIDDLEQKTVQQMSRPS